MRRVYKNLIVLLAFVFWSFSSVYVDARNNATEQPEVCA